MKSLIFIGSVVMNKPESTYFNSCAVCGDCPCDYRTHVCTGQKTLNNEEQNEKGETL